jgi:hypothetical protein
VEHWNNGMMGLRTKDISIWFACAVFLLYAFEPIIPAFQGVSFHPSH